jgi:hypothetical protein
MGLPEVSHRGCRRLCARDRGHLTPPFLNTPYVFVLLLLPPIEHALRVDDVRLLERAAWDTAASS